MPASFSTDQLIDLYKVAIEEYRFQVKLNWERITYHLTLNSALISVATGLLKIGRAPTADLFVAAVFVVGFCASIIGIGTITRGHDYYRRTVVKKTLLEDLLGLSVPIEDYSVRPTLAVGTTIGQEERLQILHNTEAWLERRLRSRSITFWIVCILVLFCAMNAAGTFGSAWLYFHQPESGVGTGSFIW